MRLSNQGRHLGAGGISLWILRKTIIVSVLSHTDVDIKIWHENTFQSGDLGEVDTFNKKSSENFYKLK